MVNKLGGRERRAHWVNYSSEWHVLVLVKFRLTPNSHGIDSLNCTLASVLETAALDLGSTKLGLATALVPCVAMYFSTWETYHTHTLFLGYLNGPTEGLIIVIAVMVVSGYYGPEVWGRPIKEVFNYPGLVGNYTFRDLWLPVMLMGLFIGHIPGTIYNVYSARKKQQLSMLPLFNEWIQIILFACCSLGWLLSPYSNILGQGHLMLYCWTVTFVFGRMTTKIILAHLLRQPFPGWTTLLTPLVAGSVIINLPYLGLPRVNAWVELWYMRLYLVFAFVVYMHWALLVINRITTFLGINCLTIRKDKNAARDSAYMGYEETMRKAAESSPNSPALSNKSGYKSH